MIYFSNRHIDDSSTEIVADAPCAARSWSQTENYQRLSAMCHVTLESVQGRWYLSMTYQMGVGGYDMRRVFRLILVLMVGYYITKWWLDQQQKQSGVPA